jgi:hypothetical protein
MIITWSSNTDLPDKIMVIISQVLAGFGSSAIDVGKPWQADIIQLKQAWHSHQDRRHGTSLNAELGDSCLPIPSPCT